MSILNFDRFQNVFDKFIYVKFFCLIHLMLRYFKIFPLA